MRRSVGIEVADVAVARLAVHPFSGRLPGPSVKSRDQVSTSACLRFQAGQHHPGHSASSGLRHHVHPLDLDRILAERLEPSAADRGGAIEADEEQLQVRGKRRRHLR